MRHVPLTKKLRDVTEKPAEMLEDSAEFAVETYEKSRDWLENNYGKALGGAAVLALAGLVGFFIGRNMDDR